MIILVVEDERALARHIVAALRREGHDVRVRHDGEEAVRAALAETHDLVVLDLNLPSLDGLGVLARLRAAHCPSRVLILTSRNELEDRVAGLRSGADDYLAKPFAVEELLARVHALGRRSGALSTTDLLTVGDLHADIANRRVTRAGAPIALTPREFELLHLFLREPGRVFSRGEICERIWQRDHRYETRTVEVFVARLRRKLDPDDSAPLLHTVRALGYVLQAHPPDA